MFLLETYDLVCGTGGTLVVDDILPKTVTAVIRLIQIGVPILLIIFGMLDLGKAVMAQKEDEIKKGQATFLKRVVAALLVFLVVSIVLLALSIVSSSDNRSNCIKCFISYSIENCTAAQSGDANSE